MNRTQWVLAVLLVAQLALLGFMALRSGGGAGQESRALLPELEALSPARIQIEGSGDESVTLVRGADGWTLADPAGYPVDGGKVDQLLEQLEGLEVRIPVVSSPRYHATFKVTESAHERRLRIWDSGEEDARIDLFLGTSPNVDVSHVRRGGDERVYEAQGLSTFDLRTETVSWVERKLIDVPFDEVVSVRLRNAHGEFELAREDAAWTLLSPAGAAPALDTAKVDTWVRSLASLYLSAPAGALGDPAQGLDNPAAVLEIRSRAGGRDLETATEEGAPAPPPAEAETVTVAVGAEVGGEGEEGKRYASRAGFGFAAILSSYDTKKIADEKLSDLEPDPD